MAEIKSALEMALERAEKFGRATQEELAASKYREQGRDLAVQYLKEDGGDLEAELKKLPSQAQELARAAVKEVLLRNIGLPRNGESDPRQAKAMAGLLQVARNKKAMARLAAEMEQLQQNFLQMRNSALQQLKARFTFGAGNMERLLETQLRQKVRVEVEHLPQFQEELRRFQGSLEDQFGPMLEDLKAKMLNC